MKSVQKIEVLRTMSLLGLVLLGSRIPAVAAELTPDIVCRHEGSNGMLQYEFYSGNGEESVLQSRYKNGKRVATSLLTQARRRFKNWNTFEVRAEVEKNNCSVVLNFQISNYAGGPSHRLEVGGDCGPTTEMDLDCKLL